MEPLVLAVDDEPGILRLIKLELLSQGFRVATASDGETALSIAAAQRPDIVLLDLLMPNLDGYEAMNRLRERSRVPIIILTARGRDEEKVRGLEMGADDYIAKPFNPSELSARIRAVLRRARGRQDGGRAPVRAGDVEVDLERRLFSKGEEQVPLTRTEWMLLDQLASHAGKVMLNTELLSKVWGPEYRDDLQYLRVCGASSRWSRRVPRSSRPSRESATSLTRTKSRPLVKRPNTLLQRRKSMPRTASIVLTRQQRPLAKNAHPV